MCLDAVSCSDFFYSFYQPETFVKVRPRFEAPLVYPMNTLHVDMSGYLVYGEIP